LELPAKAPLEDALTVSLEEMNPELRFRLRRSFMEEDVAVREGRLGWNRPAEEFAGEVPERTGRVMRGEPAEDAASNASPMKQEVKPVEATTSRPEVEPSPELLAAFPNFQIPPSLTNGLKTCRVE